MFRIFAAAILLLAFPFRSLCGGSPEPLEWVPSDAVAVFSVNLGGLAGIPLVQEALKSWPESESRMKAFEKGASSIGVKSGEFIKRIAAWSPDGVSWTAVVSASIPERGFEAAFQPLFDAERLRHSCFKAGQGRAVHLVEAPKGRDCVSRKWAAVYLDEGLVAVCEFKDGEAFSIPERPVRPLSPADIAGMMRGEESSLVWGFSRIPVLGRAPGLAKSVNSKAAKAPDGLKGWSCSMDIRPEPQSASASGSMSLCVQMAFACVSGSSARRLSASVDIALLAFSLERFVCFSSLGLKLYRSVEVETSGNESVVKGVFAQSLVQELAKFSAGR